MASRGHHKPRWNWRLLLVAAILRQLSMPIQTPDPADYPEGVVETITAMANTSPPDWRAIAKYLKVLGWQLDRKGRLPDVIARKQFQPGPGVAFFIPRQSGSKWGAPLALLPPPTSFTPGRAPPAR